jgi:hypothetical protein
MCDQGFNTPGKTFPVHSYLPKNRVIPLIPSPLQCTALAQSSSQELAMGGHELGMWDSLPLDHIFVAILFNYSALICLYGVDE